jgi:hypothetical protein
VPGWHYTQEEDAMGRGTTHQAVLYSVNFIDFSFPYDGEQPGLLVLRRFPVIKGGGTFPLVMLLVVKAQFASTYSHNHVTVRFDEGSLQQSSIRNATNGINNAIFINDVAGFMRKLRRSSHVKIEAAFYAEGPRVFEFDTQGLAAPWM